MCNSLFTIIPAIHTVTPELQKSFSEKKVSIQYRSEYSVIEDTLVGVKLYSERHPQPMLDINIKVVWPGRDIVPRESNCAHFQNIWDFMIFNALEMQFPFHTPRYQFPMSFSFLVRAMKFFCRDQCKTLFCDKIKNIAYTSVFLPQFSLCETLFLSLFNLFLLLILQWQNFLIHFLRTGRSLLTQIF